MSISPRDCRGAAQSEGPGEKIGALQPHGRVSDDFNFSYFSLFFEVSILLTIYIIYIIINYILISYISYRGDMAELPTLQFLTDITDIDIITHSAMRL